MPHIALQCMHCNRCSIKLPPYYARPLAKLDKCRRPESMKGLWQEQEAMVVPLEEGDTRGQGGQGGQGGQLGEGGGRDIT